uniref:Uncharacterized protein n=1 Tax=Oryza nivara TaxID=4536 RepID=A0A0E0I7P9_ORYNI
HLTISPPRRVVARGVASPATNTADHSTTFHILIHPSRSIHWALARSSGLAATTRSIGHRTRSIAGIN